MTLPRSLAFVATVAVVSLPPQPLIRRIRVCLSHADTVSCFKYASSPEVFDVPPARSPYNAGYVETTILETFYSHLCRIADKKTGVVVELLSQDHIRCSNLTYFSTIGRRSGFSLLPIATHSQLPSQASAILKRRS